MKVKDAVKYFKDFYCDFDEKKAKEMLGFMKLDENSAVKTLSKGMEEKLKLSLVLCRTAKLYILDEPLGGVDPTTREQILNAIVNNFSENSSMIITTHLVHDIERVFDDVVFISVILANLFLMTRKNSWDNDLIIVLSFIIVIASMIVIFISSLKIMSKYLNGNEGYLLFTLPKSGMSIIVSRLLTAVIQILCIVIISLLMLQLTMQMNVNLGFLKDIKISVILFSIVQGVWGIIHTLTVIYFCMVIGKVAFKGKNLGKIGSFIIFILISGLINWLSYKIGMIFPQTINLIGSSMFNNSNVVIPVGLKISNEVLNVNVAQSIFDIVTFIGFFLSVSYLIDKKLDL